MGGSEVIRVYLTSGRVPFLRRQNVNLFPPENLPEGWTFSSKILGGVNTLLNLPIQGYLKGDRIR